MLTSIIIPCRNEEKFIEKCIRSVQKFKIPDEMEIEILILDGMSTDRTREILEFLQKEDRRMKIIDNQKIFQVAALNKGIDNAKGNYILRLDAHSVYPENYLYALYQTWKEKKAACVGGVCQTLPGNESFQAKIVQAITTHPFGVGDSSFRTSKSDGYKDTVPYGFYPRETFIKFGKFNELLVSGEDYELSSRIRIGGGKIWQNGEVVIKYFNLPSLFKFYNKQFTREGHYNAYMWYIAPYTFTFRHSIPAFFAAGVAVGIILSLFSRTFLFIFISVLFIYVLIALFSSVQQAVRYRNILLVPVLPFCFFGFHLVYGFGILSGLIKLLLHISPVQKDKKK